MKREDGRQKTEDGRQKNPSSVLLSVLLLVVIGGCAYTSQSLLPGNMRAIHVETFKNTVDITSESSDKGAYRSYRPRLELDITNAVIDRFIYDGNLEVISRARADLVLRGELIDYIRQPLRYSDSDDVEEYRVSVAVGLTLLEADEENKIIWEEKYFIGDTTYFTADESEESAKDEAVRDLARRIVERVVEQW